MLDFNSVPNFLRNSLLTALSAMNSRLFFIALLLDLALITNHIFFVSYSNDSFLSDERIRIDRERSIPELFEYFKTLTAALLLLYAGIRERTLSYALISACLALLTIDNAIGIHEAAGKMILPDQHHVGEGIFLSIFGFIILVLLYTSYLMADIEKKSSVLTIGIVLAIFGGFAFGVDGLHFITRWYFPEFDEHLSLLEDGAELIILSLLLAVCAQVAWRSSFNIRRPAI